MNAGVLENARPEVTRHLHLLRRWNAAFRLRGTTKRRYGATTAGRVSYGARLWMVPHIAENRIHSPLHWARRAGAPDS